MDEAFFNTKIISLKYNFLLSFENARAKQKCKRPHPTNDIPSSTFPTLLPMGYPHNLSEETILNGQAPTTLKIMLLPTVWLSTL